MDSTHLAAHVERVARRANAPMVNAYANLIVREKSVEMMAVAVVADAVYLHSFAQRAVAEWRTLVEDAPLVLPVRTGEGVKDHPIQAAQM